MKHNRIVTLILVLLLLVSLLVPAMADGFDFQAAIDDFSPTVFNDKTLTVGETHKPSGALWVGDPGTQCYISDPSVIQINPQNGQVTAIGMGTAYLAIVPNDFMYEITRYTVTLESAGHGIFGSNTSKNSFSLSSLLHLIFPILIISFVACIFVLVFASLFKARKLDSAMCNLEQNPCQATAAAAVAEFTQVNGLVRFNLSMGGDSRGTHFRMWRQVFNHTVIPARNIHPETKLALRHALVRFGTHSLYEVRATQTEPEAKAAAEAFGTGGEDNVWHNLKSIPGCDVYRNVKIRNRDTASEIDAVLVDPYRGIFLLEIKSVGGQRAADGNKYISYNQLKQDPSNQIFRHQADFATYFADLSIQQKVKNVLVFSWPNQEERRFVVENSFPQMPCDIVTVERMLSYFQSQRANPITPEEREQLANKLKSCSGEHLIR